MAACCEFDSAVDGREKHILLFANPHTQKGRTHHTIQVSFDDGQTWPESHHLLLDEGLGAGYPSLTRVDDDHVGIVYEGSQAHLVFERIPRSELLHPRPVAAPSDGGASSPDSAGLSFRYKRPAEGVATIHQFEGKLPPVEGVVDVYATIHMGPANPINYVNGLPEWRPQGAVVATDQPPDLVAAKETVPGGFEIQEHKPLSDGHPQFLQTISLGSREAGQFTPAIRFGLANDGRGEKRAHVNCWLSDGRINYFAPFARPNTPYDFKLRVDLKSKRLSAWVSGRGDDDWFLVAEDVVLDSDAPKIEWAQVEMSPDGPPIEGLQVRTEPDPGLESVRPHPLAKRDRMVTSIVVSSFNRCDPRGANPASMSPSSANQESMRDFPMWRWRGKTIWSASGGTARIRAAGEACPSRTATISVRPGVNRKSSRDWGATARGFNG